MRIALSCVAILTAGCSEREPRPAVAPASASHDAAAPTVVVADASPAPTPGPDAAATAATAALPGTHPVQQILRAGGATTPCTSAQVKAARRAGSAKLKAGDADGAVAALQDLLSTCDLDPGEPEASNLDYYWFQSDLSLALFRAGDEIGCLRLLGPITTPKPPLSLSFRDLEGTKVGGAILHNEGLCRKAVESTRTAFRAAGCALADQDEAAVSLPASVLPAGAAEGCLVLTGGAGYDEYRQALEGMDVDGPVGELCPRAVLRTRGPGGAARPDVALSIDAGPLVSDSDCCNLSTLSFATAGGGRQLRVQGDGRDCFGGTATTSHDAIYAWRGAELLMIEDASVVEH